MHGESIVFSIFLIFTGAAVMATLALYARQAMLIGYIVLGMLAGPSGLALVADADLIQDMAHIGIIFLLFLLGLNLYPQKLIQLLRTTTVVTLTTSLLFAAAAWLVARAFGFAAGDCVLIGVAAMFSSTIIGLKLLPTTVLHHRHTGEIIISILLLQDLIAIVALLVVEGLQRDAPPLIDVLLLVLSLPALIGIAYVLEKHVLLRLLQRFDKIQEYVFLLAIGWCLGIAQLAQAFGLSYEIGAFVAGVAVAASPIARYIAESLKPLRDFFLVMFFFALGAGLDLHGVGEVLLPAVVLAGLMLLIKPAAFRFMLTRSAESDAVARETGWRLGQMSEFSLLLAFVALEAGIITSGAAYLVHVATLLTFVGSSYLIVFRFPTPIAVSDRLRRD
jgi:Kef-type K+ transport system membrane component KefB